MLKFWVIFLSTGLKRGAVISKKLNLGTGQKGVRCSAVRKVLII